MNGGHHVTKLQYCTIHKEPQFGQCSIRSKSLTFALENTNDLDTNHYGRHCRFNSLIPITTYNLSQKFHFHLWSGEWRGRMWIRVSQSLAWTRAQKRGHRLGVLTGLSRLKYSWINHRIGARSPSRVTYIKKHSSFVCTEDAPEKPFWHSCSYNLTSSRFLVKWKLNFTLTENHILRILVCFRWPKKSARSTGFTPWNQ